MRQLASPFLALSVLLVASACGGSSRSALPDDCEVRVDDVCYTSQSEACAAANCPPERCTILRSYPGQVDCAPAPEPIAPPSDESDPQSDPPPPPDQEQTSAACEADERHCCQPDGTIVQPGGCQPSYPQNAVPGLLRGADGRCVEDDTPCRLRCMPGDARIATPTGDVPIRELEVGELIYTEDVHGRRVTARLLRVSALAVTGPHTMALLSLSDGRRVRASPGHPSALGPELHTFSVGAQLDGATITQADSVAYDGAHTFDVLPAGPTGVYWADGVRLGSTLSSPVD